MSKQENNLYEQVVSSNQSTNHFYPVSAKMHETYQMHHFAMRCNGYFMLMGGGWELSSESKYVMENLFRGQNVSFFGPNPNSNFFEGDGEFCADRLNFALSQESVFKSLQRFHEADVDLAAKLSYIYGGVVRHHTARNIDRMASRKSVDYIARKTLLSGEKSALAIASASAMYVLSGGNIKNTEGEQDKSYNRQLYNMAGAIALDPVYPYKTQDLGLSQVTRLRQFERNESNIETNSYLNLNKLIDSLEGFPTVGAEFHFRHDAPKLYPNFLERLALLNASQYQEGSYIQMSRNDRGVFEVRMNPSIYPITIANWKHMKNILPELDRAYFTITINRQSEENFDWSANEKSIVRNLQAIGMLSYADWFESMPITGEKEEINFGTIYLGQTVKLHQGDYTFNGMWSGHEGHNGQMGIYTGFGDNLEHLAYYLSMVLQDQKILGEYNGFLKNITTIPNALAINERSRKTFFRNLSASIQNDEQLSKADRDGREILKRLMN